MNALGLNPTGGLGTQMFQYAYARARAEREMRKLHVSDWIGSSIFDVEHDPVEDGDEVLPNLLRQTQDDLIYTRDDCRRWFRFRQHIQAMRDMTSYGSIVMHLRDGDYASRGYPVVSEAAVVSAADGFGYDVNDIIRCRQDGVRPLVDFLVMIRAVVLFRSNSAFSWWASVLGNAITYAPVITGLRGGTQYDSVPFVRGNWPRFIESDVATDLYLNDQVSNGQADRNQQSST